MSKGGGALLVLTEQKRQPLVHVSPISMIVAVAFDLSEPPQQSPMLGHLASSQTVCSLSPRRSSFILVNEAPVGIFVLRKEGRRGWDVFPSVTVSTSGTGPRIKSSRLGPSSSFCLNGVDWVASVRERAEHCLLARFAAVRIIVVSVELVTQPWTRLREFDGQGTYIDYGWRNGLQTSILYQQ